MAELLTRDEFREAVFERDQHRCVVCGAPGQDAHHIMERRLFPDGGYYLDNGATVCEVHHLECESTRITTHEIRQYAGITKVILPPHLYDDQEYDKWGNPVNPLQHLRGELYYDESVQRALKMMYPNPDSVFKKYVKYPRTYHVPWSPTPSKDDRINYDFNIPGDCVVTEKMDGENTTMYDDYIHARSVDGRSHPSRDWVKQFWAEHIAYQIPPDMRICGENLFAEHSIHYSDLPSFFLGFAMWERDWCMGWRDTEIYLGILGIETVPVLYEGPFDPQAIQEATAHLDFTTSEGYVVRPADEFSLRDFPRVVGKFVRPDHVQTTKHWMHGQPVRPNSLG